MTAKIAKTPKLLRGLGVFFSDSGIYWLFQSLALERATAPIVDAHQDERRS
jgi:hypothetical protein